MSFFQFFFGTPKRFLATLGTLGVIGLFIIEAVSPGLLFRTSRGIVSGLMPLLEALMFYALVFLMIAWGFGALFKKGGKK